MEQIIIFKLGIHNFIFQKILGMLRTLVRQLAVGQYRFNVI
jgi:hypothetical protein